MTGRRSYRSRGESLAHRLVAGFAFALALAAVASWYPASAGAQQSINVTCTFSNPAYAGSCVERTTRSAKQKPGEACQPILDCLNNPNCAKSYCQATTVRQGWSLKSAE